MEFDGFFCKMRFEWLFSHISNCHENETNLHGEPPLDFLELCQFCLGLLVVRDGLDAAVVPHRGDAGVHNAPGV